MADLTEREYAILRGFAAGRTRAQIARELRRAPATLEASVRRLFAKLDAANEAHAVDIGHRQGLLGDPRPVSAQPTALIRRVWDNADVIARRRRVLLGLEEEQR